MQSPQTTPCAKITQNRNDPRLHPSAHTMTRYDTLRHDTMNPTFNLRGRGGDGRAVCLWRVGACRSDWGVEPPMHANGRESEMGGVSVALSRAGCGGALPPKLSGCRGEEGRDGWVAQWRLDESESVSPLTPALSPLRGEGEEAAAPSRGGGAIGTSRP